jgi:hypothetical protein
MESELAGVINPSIGGRGVKKNSSDQLQGKHIYFGS